MEKHVIIYLPLKHFFSSSDKKCEIPLTPLGLLTFVCVKWSASWWSASVCQSVSQHDWCTNWTSCFANMESNAVSQRTAKGKRFFACFFANESVVTNVYKCAVIHPYLHTPSTSMTKSKRVNGKDPLTKGLGSRFLVKTEADKQQGSREVISRSDAPDLREISVRYPVWHHEGLVSRTVCLDIHLLSSWMSEIS